MSCFKLDSFTILREWICRKLSVIPIILAHCGNGIRLSGRVYVWHSLPSTRTTAAATVKFKRCLMFATERQSVNISFLKPFGWFYIHSCTSQRYPQVCKCVMHWIPLWGCPNLHYLPHLLTKWTQHWCVLINVYEVYTLFLWHICEEVLLFLLWSFCHFPPCRTT